MSIPKNVIKTSSKEDLVEAIAYAEYLLTTGKKMKLESAFERITEDIKIMQEELSSRLAKAKEASEEEGGDSELQELRSVLEALFGSDEEEEEGDSELKKALEELKKSNEQSSVAPDLNFVEALETMDPESLENLAQDITNTIKWYSNEDNDSCKLSAVIFLEEAKKAIFKVIRNNAKEVVNQMSFAEAMDLIKQV